MPVLADVLAVVDAGDSQIELRLRTTLAVVLAVGSAGSGNAQLNTPTHIALDENFVHIQDTGNARVSRWNWADLSYFGKVTWASLGLGWNVNCLAIDKVQMFLGRVSASLEIEAYRFMSPYTNLGEHALVVAGTMVGVAVDNDYIYIADSATNRVLRYSLGGGAATIFNTIPAGYTVAGLAMDSTQLYIPCNHASNDTKVLILDKTAMTLTTSGDLTAKKVCYAMTVDDTKLFWTDTGDHSINWILKTLAGPITSATNLTAPRGVAVLSPIFDDLHDTATVLSGGAVSGGASSASAPVYPILPTGAAVGGGAAAGSFDPSLPAGAAVSGGAASATLVVNPSLPGGAAVSGGAAAGSLDPSLSHGASVGGGLAAGSFESSGPADRMVVSSDENDSVAVLTDVTRE